MNSENLLENPEKITLNNYDEVDQILGHPPSWILRWGLTLVLFTVIILGGIAWLIKYPDVIPAEVTIITENPTIPIVARASGKASHLFVENFEKVKKDQIIAIIDNPANHNDILELKKLLNQIPRDFEHSNFDNFISSKNLSLGNIQSSYANLEQKILEFKFFLSQNFDQQKIKSLFGQIRQTELLNKNLEKQKMKLDQEIQLSKKDFNRNTNLNQEGVVSDVDCASVFSFLL